MTRYARRRDANEAIIIAALQAVGASVQQLDGDGVPDLLVGYRGETFLLEAKAAHGRPGIGMKRNASGLRASQERWMRAWKGTRPVVVTNADEALRAIGARRDER